MPADSTPGSGRVLSGASLRQGVGVKPWEKALVQHCELGMCNVVKYLLENWLAGEMLQIFGACGGQGASRRR